MRIKTGKIRTGGKERSKEEKLIKSEMKQRI